MCYEIKGDTMANKELSRKEKLEKKRQQINHIMCLPIVILLGLVPLIVRMDFVRPKDLRMYGLFAKSTLDDFYSQYKSIGIIIMTICMLLLTYLFIEKQDIKLDKPSKLYLICSGILVLMTLLSTMTSAYKEIAIWGVYDRAEGMIIWCCYIIIMLYTFYIIRDEKGYKWIIGSLIFLIIVTTILGAFQYAGHDLLVKTKIGQALIIPKEQRELVKDISSDYASHKVLGTLFHYDYVGSFGAMIVPLFATLTLMIKPVKQKVILGLVTLASLFILLGSTSRAGLVGTGLALVVGVIIFSKEIIAHWKKSISIGVGLIVVLVGFNFMTKGSIFSRIPTLVEDAIAMLTKTEENFDYKDQLPVRAIHQEDGKVTFVLQEHELTLSFNERLNIQDEVGTKVDYTTELSQINSQDGSVVTVESYGITDARYGNIQLYRQPMGVFNQKERLDTLLVIVDSSAYFYFKIDDMGLHSIDYFTGEEISYVEAQGIGFKGKEKLGSARGYIWSRALAVFVQKNLLIGNGPDTFVAYFPQNDLLAKWWAYGATNIIVDKAHNLYLQIGMNQGGIALVAFLVLCLGYIVQSLKLYAFKERYCEVDEAVGIGVMLAVMGYLGAAFFNDSVVSVAPIFWILLGCGMAVNYRVKEKQIKTMEY